MPQAATSLHMSDGKIEAKKGRVEDEMDLDTTTDSVGMNLWAHFRNGEGQGASKIASTEVQQKGHKSGLVVDHL